MNSLALIKTDNHCYCKRRCCILIYSFSFSYRGARRQAIGWLSVPLLTQHRTLCGMLDQYAGRGILLHPPIQFGRQHTYSTRCPAHFAMIARCRLALSKRHFLQKATSWWNSLPLELFSRLSSFRYNLYKYLVCIV